jgi:hypothetical protein
MATPDRDDPREPPLSVFGWREAFWTADAEGNAVIDHGRPASLDTCRVGQVLETVCRECPEHLPWVAEQLERYVRVLHLQTRHDAAGRRAPSAALAARTLRYFVSESEEALAAMDSFVVDRGREGDRLPRQGSLRDLTALLDAQGPEATPTSDSKLR